MTWGTVKTGGRRRRPDGAGRTGTDGRFGLSADAVRPLFGELSPAGARGGPVRRGPGAETVPQALALYEPGLTTRQRRLARLGTSGTVTFGLPPRPVSTKGLAAVSVGGVLGMMLAQPFDAVTFVAPLYGLLVGAGGGAIGWVSVKGRRATTIAVADWRPQLDAIERILADADRLGQPFLSAPGLRSALHSALWHAVRAVDEPGAAQVLGAFDQQLAALGQATESALVELEAPLIEARTAAVSERLATAVSEIELTSGSPLN